MEANHTHFTRRKSLYVEVSRARRRAEILTDDREALKERLEAATGERVAALKAVVGDQAKTPASEPGFVSARDLEGNGADSDATGRRPEADKTS